MNTFVRPFDMTSGISYNMFRVFTMSYTKPRTRLGVNKYKLKNIFYYQWTSLQWPSPQKEKAK